MRNKILRSANDKYHYSNLLFFFNKGDLPLMYSCVFWRKFIDQIGFFGCYCLTPVTLFIIRVKGITEKQPAVQTVSTRRQFAARKPIQSQIFSTRGKLLSSLQRIKRLETKYPTHVARNEHFLEPCPKYLLSPDTDTATGHGALAPRSNFPRPRVAQSN